MTRRRTLLAWPAASAAALLARPSAARAQAQAYPTKTVTVVVPGNTRYGQADPDVTITVPAGGTSLIGPLPRDLADPADGLVHITYSAVTSLTVAAVAI